MKLYLRVIGFLTLAVGAFSAPSVVVANDQTNAEANAEAKAAGVVVVVRKKIIDYNSIKPLQNPRYERSEKIIKRRVTNRKNKVIGEVKDVLFNHGGKVKSIYVDFDRLNLRKSVYLSFNVLDISSTASGYRLALNSDEVEDFYPKMLSSIEAASGDANGTLYSLNDVLGSVVIDSDGRFIGKLEDILFNSEGTYVRSAYLNISFRTIHNKGVAVPLSILEFEEKFGKSQIIIDKSYIEPILEMARED